MQDHLGSIGYYPHEMNDVAMIEDLESSFGLRFSDEECASWYKVGDIYRCLLQKLQPLESGKCASAEVFYVMRRHLRDKYPEVPLSPDSSLDELPRDARDFLRDQLSQSFMLVGVVSGF